MGLGSIGSMLAGYFAENYDVYAVGREWHVKPIIERGYLILRILFKSETRNVKLAKVSTSLKEFTGTRFDAMFVCVKAYDLENALAEIVSNNIDADCYVFLQNGLGIEELAAKIIRNRNIIRALTNNGANIPEPGVVNHAGLGKTYISGVFGEKKIEWGKRITELFNSVGLPAEYVRDITPYVFRKVAINAVINSLTAILRIKNRGVADLPELRGIVRGVCREIKEIAKKKGLNLGKLEEIVLSVAKETGENISSMLQDILRNKRTEIDFINGAIVKLGKELGVPTPVNETLYRLVKAIEKSREYRV